MKLILKLGLLACIAIALPIITLAQTTQVATLLHDGEVTVFYGGNGFKEAVDAASDGDVITLSSGTFTSPQIKKSLVIRGSGIKLGMENETEIPTTLTSGLAVYKPDDDKELILTIEGIDIQKSCGFNLKCNVTLNKCRVDGLTINNQGYKLTIMQSEVQGHFAPTEGGSIQAINSVIKSSIHNIGSNSGAVSFENCVIENKEGKTGFTFFNAQLTNCIIDMAPNASGYDHIEKEDAVLTNCILRTDNAEDCEIDPSSMIVSASTPLFKQDGYYVIDDNISSFKGYDNTEIGIHGGKLPINLAVSGPTISKLEVSPKSSADGKISIDFTIKAAE